MAITFLDLYNEVTGQAWSMFDGDVEAQDEFETTVTSSIQKALSALWCSYNFPFRNKTVSFRTRNGVVSYAAPEGNIVKKTIKNKTVYGIKIGKNFLKYIPDYELLEDKKGEPTHFYYKNDEIYLYPTPDSTYMVDVEYWTIFTSCDENGISKATLENESDYIDVPEKYENLFKMALLPLSMVYAIASQSDENHSGYQKQYDEAYKNLIKFTRGIDIEKRIGWRA